MYNTTCKITLISLAIFILSSNLAAQEFDSKNAVYVTYGNLIWTDQVSLSYERTLFQKNQFITKARIVGGNFMLNKGGSPENVDPIQWYAGVMATQLYGILEGGLGVGVTRILETNFVFPDNPIDPAPEPEFKNKIRAMGNLGLRWEFDHFLIRFGLGYPELAYLGLGVKF